jgi:hypothetical protein
MHYRRFAERQVAVVKARRAENRRGRLCGLTWAGGRLPCLGRSSLGSADGTGPELEQALRFESMFYTLGGQLSAVVVYQRQTLKLRVRSPHAM